MSEFKEMEVQEDYNEKISTLATKLAINKYNAVQGKNINLDTEISENIKLVNNKISQIYKEIQVKSQGLELPRDLNDTIAEYLLRSLKPGQSEISQIETKGSISEKIFFESVLKNQEPEVRENYINNRILGNTAYFEENPREYMIETPEMLISKLESEGIFGYQIIQIDPAERFYIEGVGQVTRTIKMPSGKELQVVEPEDEVFKKPEEEPDYVEDEIEIKKDSIERINAKVKLNRKENEVKENLIEYEKLLNGLGIDAAMRNLYYRINYNGVISLLRNDDYTNMYDRETFKKLLKAITPENASQNGYEEDQYTIMNKMGIYARIMNDPAMQGDSKYQLEIREALRTADPELFERIEKDPLLFDKMQKVAGYEDFLAVASTLFGKDTLERDAIFEIIDEFMEKHNDLELDSDKAHKYDNFEKIYMEELNERNRHQVKAKRFKSVGAPSILGKLTNTRMVNKKTLFAFLVRRGSQMFSKEGPGIAVTSFFNKSRIDTDKRGTIIPIVEKCLDFENEDRVGNYVSQITSKDIELMQKALQNLSQYEDDEKYTPYIKTLEEIIEKSKMKIQEWNISQTAERKQSTKQSDNSKIKSVPKSKDDYKIPENEEKDTEIEIEIKRDKINSLYDEARKNSSNVVLRELGKEYNNLLNGLGIDAAMRSVHDQLTSSGAISFLRADDNVNLFYKNTVIKLLQAITPENVAQSNYKEDQYTMMNKLGIYSKLMNDPIMQENGKSARDIKYAMRKADPELYLMLEKEPLLFEKMQTAAGNKDFLIVANKLMGSQTLSREEILANLDEFRRKYQNYGVELEESSKYERFEENYFYELNYRNRKRTFGRISKK